MGFEREEIGKISPDTEVQCDVQAVAALLADVRFPVSKQELLRTHGHEKLPCSGGDRHTLSELLADLSKEQYNSIPDIQDALAHPVRLAH
jgi:hypothetical protein